MADTITLKLFASLGKDFGRQSEVPVDGPTTVGEVLVGLGVPTEKAAIILVNNRHANLPDPIEPGDVIAVFPPVGGG